MVRNCLIVSLFLSLFIAAEAQDSLRPALTLPSVARLATADHLGNLYLVTPGNAVEQYAPDGRLLTRYTNNRLGPVAALDVSNPLKILVWFADFRTVVFLNRSLTLLGELNLIEAGYPEVRTVSAAADGNLWLYDETAFRLRKVSPEGMPLQESQGLDLLLPDRLQITCLRDDGSRVIAADSVQGLLLFDVYAQFSRQVNISGVRDFQLQGDELVYCQAGILLRQPLSGLAPARRQMLPPEARAPGAQVWLAPGRVLVQRGGTLLVFKF